MASEPAAVRDVGKRTSWASKRTKWDMRTPSGRPVAVRGKQVGELRHRLIFEPTEPVLDLKVVVARQVPPESGPLDLLQPRSGPFEPRLPGREDLLDLPLHLRIVQVAGIPQAPLPDRRLEPDLEHVAHRRCPVGSPAVPDAVVEGDDRPGRADHGHLAGMVLVTGDGALVDPTEVAAGDDQRPTRLDGHLARVVHELDVEGR